MRSYFWCRQCDSYMDNIEALQFQPEVHTELDEKPTEWIAENRCIYCGSDDLTDAGWCEECGELFPDTLLDENGICEACREKLAGEAKEEE